MFTEEQSNCNNEIVILIDFSSALYGFLHVLRVYLIVLEQIYYAQFTTKESIISKNRAESNDKNGPLVWELDKLLQCLHIPALWRCGRGNILTMPNQGGNIHFDVPQSATFHKQCYKI